MENTASVTFEFCYLPKFRVFPDAQLVVDEAMGGENLLVVGVPQECTNLTVCCNLVYHLTSLCIPKLYAFVSTATARGKKISLPRAPRQSLHSCFMVSEDRLWAVYRHILKGICVLRKSAVSGQASSHAVVQIPNAQLIVVASACKLGSVRAPCEPANFLLMTFKSAN